MSGKPKGKKGWCVEQNRNKIITVYDKKRPMRKNLLYLC